jgi:hypothetical protein
MLRRLLFLKIFLAAFYFFGCAPVKPAKAPSTAAVRGQMQTARQQLSAAVDSVKAASKGNEEISSLSDRMERKAVLIDRWMETHQ